MAKYRIFAGLNGGFGGTVQVAIEEHETLADAEDSAYEYACAEYESYGGMHGLFNQEEALEEDPDLTEDDLADMENEDRENWIEYWAKEYIEGDEDDD